MRKVRKGAMPWPVPSFQRHLLGGHSCYVWVLNERLVLKVHHSCMVALTCCPGAMLGASE